MICERSYWKILIEKVIMNIDISISDRLRSTWSKTAIGVLSYDANAQPGSKGLWEEINKVCDEISSSLSIEDIAKQPAICDTREAYKACGKKPSRYRVSSEALMRRIILGKGLYRVNNIVDINNLISIKSGFSLGSFNLVKIAPPVVFDIGNEGETYEGIGKGIINISHLPLFRDQLGPFGSPTSDSERAKVTLEARSFLTVVISFSGKDRLSETIDLLEGVLSQYTDAEGFVREIV